MTAGPDLGPIDDLEKCSDYKKQCDMLAVDKGPDMLNLTMSPEQVEMEYCK